MADFNKYYRAYILMQETLKGDFTHSYLTSTLADADTGSDELSGKNYSRVIDMDWVEAIEDAIPYIDKAIREQRRFIIQNEDIVPIEKARKITSESVRHLAQHTNLIARVEDDDVTPERILDIQREESFAIYENRFLRTLLIHASKFVDDRYKEMKHAPNDSYQKIHLSRHLTLNHQVLDFELTYSNESHEQKEFDINADVSTLTDFQRVRRIRRVLADFSASALIRALTNTEMVRPPIQRTNLMTKNPNFKKALDLYLFITSYKKTGFEIVGKEYTGKMDEEVQLAMYNVMSYEHFVISIATNPALRRLLHEKYLEENARLETEALRPEEQILAETEKRIAAVRAEEAQLRLEEIRDREKQINDLNSQLNHAKFTLRQYETKMTEMKGLINLHETTIQQLKDQVFEIEKEKKVLSDKVEELTALSLAQASTIEAQAGEIASLKAELESKNQEIAKHLETIQAAKEAIEKLKAECDRLTEENAALSDTVSKQTEEISQLQGEIEVARAELYKNAEEIGLLKETVSKRDTQISAMTEEISSLSGRLSALSDEYENAKTQHIAETEQMRQDFSTREAELISSHETVVSSMQSAHSKELADLKHLHEQNISEQQQIMESRLREQTESFRSEFKAMIDSHSSEVQLLSASHETALATVRSEYEKQLASSADKHRTELERQSASAKKSMDALESRHKKAFETAEAKHKKAFDTEHTRYQRELDKKQKEYDRLLAEERRRAKAEIAKAKREAELKAKEAIRAAELRLASQQSTDAERQSDSRHIGTQKFGFYFHKK